MSTPQWIVLVVVLAVVVIGYRAYTRRPQSTAPTTIPTDPNEFMPEMADRAVQYATEHGKALDYTPDSVKSVEAMLGELHESRARQQLSDRDLNVQALHFGAYIGEVIRRKHGGSWSTDHPVAGPKTFPIHWNGGESFPIGWCGKRILNGDEDNVWFKFKVVTSDEYQRGAMTQPTGGHPKAE
jgi:hypothetical protein